VLDLPRAARLALWGTAVLDGDTDAGTALRAVQRDDEPHGVDGDVTVASTLPELLAHLASVGATGLRAALPAPGDPCGIAGPPAFTAEAPDAGEAVLTCGTPVPWGLVPDVTEFGSVYEPGALVTWRVRQVAPAPPPSESLADAERALREAMRTATEALADLDVSRWREDAADRIAAVRDGSLARDVLPPAADPRVARVLATAARVRAIAGLALEDDGAAVTGWEATQRARALREVDAVARRCLATAVNSQTADRPSTSR
jgi:hypothetical protein